MKFIAPCCRLLFLFLSLNLFAEQAGRPGGLKLKTIDTLDRFENLGFDFIEDRLWVGRQNNIIEFYDRFGKKVWPHQISLVFNPMVFFKATGGVLVSGSAMSSHDVEGTGLFGFFTTKSQISTGFLSFVPEANFNAVTSKLDYGFINAMAGDVNELLGTYLKENGDRVIKLDFTEKPGLLFPDDYQPILTELHSPRQMVLQSNGLFVATRLDPTQQVINEEVTSKQANLRGQNVLFFDRATGKRAWVFKDQNYSRLTSLVALRDKISVAVADSEIGKVFLIDAATGGIKSQVETKLIANSSLKVSELGRCLVLAKEKEKVIEFHRTDKAVSLVESWSLDGLKTPPLCRLTDAIADPQSGMLVKGKRNPVIFFVRSAFQHTHCPENELARNEFAVLEQADAAVFAKCE